jgi:hypothetical protein
MVKQGWSEASGELEGRQRFSARRLGDTNAERQSQGVEWRRWLMAIPTVPFIGWQREESRREMKGNGDRWWWSLNPSVSCSQREMMGGERMGWRHQLTFTGRWHGRAAGSMWCSRTVSRGRRRWLAHREVGDEGRSGPGGPRVGYKGRMDRLMLQGRWRKKKRGEKWNQAARRTKPKGVSG